MAGNLIIGLVHMFVPDIINILKRGWRWWWNRNITHGTHHTKKNCTNSVV